MTSFVAKLTSIFKNNFTTIILVSVAFFVGYFVHQPRVVYVDQPVEVFKEVPTVQTVTKTQTEVQYIEKGSPYDPDVDLQVEQPKVAVRVNGKDHKFDLVQGETQKFEDGKVVMKQQSQITFDVKVPDRNELLLSAEAEVNSDGVTPNVVLEKRNGKFHYGGKYDVKENEFSAFAKYDVIRLYTE